LLAAKQDYENAQYNIAFMYYNGQVDGRQDLPKAYMWAVISSAGGEPEPIRFRKMLEQKLPASDVAQGQREAIRWRSENITPK
jgi:TPR repeat protein